jgi:hypothetical protein
MRGGLPLPFLQILRLVVGDLHRHWSSTIRNLGSGSSPGSVLRDIV